MVSAQQIPHPPRRVPLVGDILGLDPVTPMQATMRMLRRLGPIYQRRILGTPIVFVSDPGMVAQVNDETVWEKHVGRPLQKLRPTLGDGLFTAHNDEPNWAKGHRILAPAFTAPAMRSYHATMRETAHEMVATWDSAPGYLDVADEMTKLTFETIGRVGFGYRFGAFSQAQQDPFVTAMLRVLEFSQSAGMPVPGLDAVLNRKRIAANNADIDTLHEVVQEVVAARRTEPDTRHSDLLELMLTSKDEDTGAVLDDANIVHQVLTFLAAGYETTSSALSFALWFLATRPDVLEQAQQEVDAAWPDETLPNITFEQVPKLRYLRRVIDESLRLWPTAPGYFRQAKEHTSLGDYEFEAGASVLVVVLQLHRDVTVWGDDADEFNTDRFLPKNIKARPGQSYKPFGTGMRACIGRQFAYHEMLIALATLVRRYEFSVEDGYDLRVKEQLTLKPDGFRIKVRQR
ncbi:MAG: cytochrome P450 [Tomitella sp.]|nr:cytochrome P450 [Tomitella sp.]